MFKKRLATSLLVIAVLAGPGAWAGKHKEAPAASIVFTILKDYSGKPLRNAAVVLHPVNNKDQQENGGLELKTDAEGHASYDGIPYGKLRVQVLANGFQTYGADYDINQPSLEFTVKMKRPTGQYSIYEDHPEEKKPEASKPQ